MSESSGFDIGVRDLIGKPGAMREVEAQASFSEHVGEGLAIIPAQARFDLDVRLESVHEGILATGTADFTADAECSRCLVEFELPMRIDFVELFAYHRTEDSDLQVVDAHIDLGQVVRDAAVLALPFNPVDRPDCAGLDPVTGERLAPGTERRPEETLDPRWAALQGLLEDDTAAQTREPEKE